MMYYMFYPNTCAAIANGILSRCPEEVTTQDITKKPGYLLWMMQEIQTFTDSEKAARWIGWIIAHAELLGIMDNNESRRLVRMDVTSS